VRLTLTEADLSTAPELTPADLVLLVYLQIPSEPSHAVTRRAAATVAAGGRLLYIAHAKRNLTDGVGGPQDVEVLRSVDEVVAHLTDTGLEIEVAEEVLRPVETEAGARDAIDVLVRARRPATRG
jgi:hypothetical protein